MLAPLCRKEVLLLFGRTVMEELGVNALEVGATLLDHAVAHPHERPDLLDVLGWDPRLRQPVDDEQLPEMFGGEPIGLGPLLASPQNPGVRWLRQVRITARSLKLLDDVAPAGCRLQSEGGLPATEAFGELLQPRAQVLAVSRADLAPVALAGLDLYVVEGDLLPMHVESAYNVHVVGPPQAPLLTQHGYGLMPAFELRGSTLLYFTCHLLRFLRIHDFP